MPTTRRKKSTKESEPAATWVDVSALTPWADNPRKNDGRPVEAVADSIKRFGFAAPIIARQEDGMVIAGHTRLKAAIKLGLDRVPVRYLDLDPADSRLLALADNKVGELAEWDDEALARIVADIDGAELALAGFTEEDLSDILAAVDGGPIGPDDIEPEEPPEDPNSQRGEVYELGPHRLICGDSTDAATVGEAVAGGIGATVTDPPYGINASRMTMGSGESAKPRSARLSGVQEWDDSAPPMAWALDLAGLLCVWGGNYFPDLPTSDDWLIWHKKNDGLSFAEAELAWTNFGKRIRVLQHHWSGEKKQHITQKPLPVIEWCLSFVPQGARVFDPFGGSGTTLIACARTGRTATLIELDPGYCDVIRKRWTAWAKEAGQEPGPGALS